MGRLLKNIDTISPEQQIEFRALLISFIESVPESEDELIRRVMVLEQWVAQQIDVAVFEATKPYIKINPR